jgi:hypothetical protein
MCVTIGRPLLEQISEQALSTIEGLCFLRGPCRGIIKGQRRSFESFCQEIGRVNSTCSVHSYIREDNIRMNIIEMRCDDVDLSHLAPENIQWRDHLDTVMNFRVPYRRGIS